MNFDASFWVAIAFFAFIAVLIKLKVPSMLTQGLDSHADKVKNELELAETMRKEAEALALQYSNKLAEAEAEAIAMQERTQREISAMKSDAETAIEDYILRRTKAAEARIAQAEQTILQDLKAKATDIATDASIHLISKHVASAKGADIMVGSIKDLSSKL